MTLVPTDVRYAVRRWAARPGLAMTVVLTLGLGIGTATAIFSLVDGVLLRPLPWQDPDRLVSVYVVREPWRTDPVMSFMWDTGYLSWPNFRDLQRQNQAFASVGALRRTRPLTIEGESGVLQGLAVSSSFLQTLGASPLAGRNFTAAEDEAPSDSVIISYETWQRRFGGRRDIVGRRVTVDEVPRTIVGVMPRGFYFEGPTDLFLPSGTLSPGERSADQTFLRVVARLADGVTPEQAAGSVASVLNGGQGREQRMSRVVSTIDDQVGRSRAPLLTLLGAAVLLLLIACVNVAGLLLGEAGARRQEVAVRRALGAGRWRVTRQMLVESALLATAGGVAGVVAAWWIVPSLVALAPNRLPRIDTVAIDARVLIFAAMLSGLTTVLAGIMPSMAGSAASPIDALRAARATGRLRSRTQRLIVATQVAIAVVLLTGAALLGESMIRLTSVPLGFDDKGLLVLSVTVSRSLAPDVARRARLDSELLDGIRALPGVEAAAATASPPFGTSFGANALEVSGRPGERLSAQRHIVSEDFFTTMRMPILRGRGFERADAVRQLPGPAAPGAEVDDTLGVAIVSRELERRYFSGSAVGQRIRFNRIWHDIIGVAPDVKSQQYADESGPAFYVYSRQVPYITVGQFVIRASGEPDALVPALRELVTRADRRLVIASVETMQTLLGRSVANQRYRATLSSVFGMAALLLAAIGLFGLLTRTVNERRREIGVRMAVGAKPRDVVQLVIREGGLLVAGGLIVGVPTALATAQLIRTQLFGVGPSDPHVFILVSVVLGTVACAAMLIPAMRAARVDPISTLRAE
jgi:putative ABC transport system permease protein